MNTNLKDPLDKIFFISIPDEFNETIGSFVIDKSKKLPVEIDGNPDEWDPAGLSWEMIISAMLKIMAYQPFHDDIEYYREFVLAVQPDITAHLSNSALVKVQDKEYALAEEIFLVIEGLTPGNMENKLNIATLFDKQAEHYANLQNQEKMEQYNSSAGAAFLQILSEDDVLPEAWYNAGQYYLRIRDWNKMNECFTSYAEKGEDEEKKTMAKKILNKYNSILSHEDIFSSAYQEILSDNEELGIRIISDFLKTNPNVWNGWFLLGWAYRKLGKYTEAKTALNKSAELNPQDADILNELAICEMEMGNFDESKKQMEKALALTPENLKIVSNMGILELKMGNPERAKNYFETVLVLEPEDPIAKAYLDQL